ncbi:MAG: hypothetical protein ABSF36_07800 [Candidatus Methanomethylicaceae archaeon]|jgi:hypothetical protein
MNEALRENTKGNLLDAGALIFASLYATTFQALLDAAGPERAIELMKPYLKVHYETGSSIIKDLYKLNTDDLASLAGYFKSASILFWGMPASNFEFFDDGFTFEISYCWQQVGEAWCSLHCEYALRTNLRALNDNYEECLTRSYYRGDPICQVMIKKKGANIRGEIRKKPVEICTPQPSKEELAYYHSAHLSQSWIYATNALVDFAGKERAMEILRPYMRELGMSTALELTKKLGIKGRDAASIAAVIEYCNRVANQKGKMLVETPERVEKELTECILVFANAPQDICANALEARSNGICEMINPEYEFRTIKRMCKGDKTCQWVIKKKSAPL